LRFVGRCELEPYSTVYLQLCKKSVRGKIKSEVTASVPTTGTADVGELTTCLLPGKRAHITYAARASFQGERKYGELLFYLLMLKLTKKYFSGLSCSIKPTSTAYVSQPNFNSLCHFSSVVNKI